MQEIVDNCLALLIIQKQKHNRYDDAGNGNDGAAPRDSITSSEDEKACCCKHDHGAGKGIRKPCPPLFGIVMQIVYSMKYGSPRNFFDFTFSGINVYKQAASIEENF